MNTQTEQVFRGFLRLTPEGQQDLIAAVNKPGHQPATYTELFEARYQKRVALGLSPAKALFDDLCVTTDKLERLLFPLEGLIGAHYLEEPREQRWFAFRPGSIAEIDLEYWGSESGKWEDCWSVLSWCDGGIGAEAYRPHLVFSSPEGCLFNALNDPLRDRDSTNITVDGLLYVRDNIARLLHAIQGRIDLLHTHGLVADYPLFTTQLQQLAVEYQQAGAGCK